MCGFVGGLLRRPLDGDRLDRGLNTLHHRGPDATGKWVSPDGLCFLGHTRLSIVGLENGRQPMASFEQDVQLVVNGEFYGYRDIRTRLRLEGSVFTTDSDSEIALHLYLRTGVGLTRELRGEFAAVIADRRDGTMIAIRDRFGIKPLFYAVHDGDIFFASEIKALLALGVPARWNRVAFLQESFHFRPNDRSLFEGIYSVPPGHYAIARGGSVTLHPYWDMVFPEASIRELDDRTDSEVVAGFRAALDDAVRERLVADVEVATYLGGGIDSCAILGLAQRHMDRPINAFTVGFDDVNYDEAALARGQAEHSGANFNLVRATARKLADCYSDAVWHAETCFINAHGPAKFLLSRAVRDAGIKVVITGEGADELLAGYAPFRRDILIASSRHRDIATYRSLLAELRAREGVPPLVSYEATSLPTRQTVRQRIGWQPSWVRTFSGLGDDTVSAFRPEMALSVAEIDPYQEALDGIAVELRLAGRDPLNQSLYLWSKIQLPNFTLTVLADRMEMAHSIEGRTPFLDHRVAEYAAAMPVHMKINRMREKHVLREAARDVVIPAVYDRAKQPFATPPVRFDKHGAMAELFGDVFASKMLDEQPIFNPAVIRRLHADLAHQSPAEQSRADNLMNRVLSTTLLHQRFAMSA